MAAYALAQDPPTGGLDLHALIDSERYPLHAPESAPYRAAVAEARRGLAGRECAVLPAFVRPDVVARMREEAAGLAEKAVYWTNEHNPYFSKPVPEAGPDDPRNRFFRRTNGLVAGESFDRGGTIWALYKSPEMLRFVRDCLALEELHYYCDPFGCLNVSVQKPGCEFSWHFDTNEFTTSILLQAPEAGGVFQFVPNIRTGTDENHAAVCETLDGLNERVVSLDLRPGDLQLFKGRYSLHRVTAPEGGRERLIALFAYALTPDMYANPERAQFIWGKVHPAQVEAFERRRRADALLD